MYERNILYEYYNDFYDYNRPDVEEVNMQLNDSIIELKPRKIKKIFNKRFEYLLQINKSNIKNRSRTTEKVYIGNIFPNQQDVFTSNYHNHTNNLILPKQYVENEVVYNILNMRFTSHQKLISILHYILNVQYFEKNIMNKKSKYVENYLKEKNITLPQSSYINIGTSLLIHCIHELRLRFQLRKFIALWRCNRLDTKYIRQYNSSEPIDPITLCEIEQPITIYDFKNNKKCIFEAKTLNRAITAKLKHQMYGFAEPQEPRNPYTNITFTYAQLVSITHQLNKYGQVSWILGSFKHYDFSLGRWKSMFETHINLSSMFEEIKTHDSADSIEMLMEFLYDQARRYGIQMTSIKLNIYEKFIKLYPNHRLTGLIRQAYMIHNEITETNTICPPSFLLLIQIILSHYKQICMILYKNYHFRTN
jgi:hypothetical protein